MYFLGEFNVIIFTYFKSTNLFILIMAMIMIVMFILPIFFIRKMKKIVALLILTTVLAAFFKVPIYFFDRVNEIYNKYSYEEWNECPVVRRVMYKSLYCT